MNTNAKMTREDVLELIPAGRCGNACSGGPLGSLRLLVLMKDGEWDDDLDDYAPVDWNAFYEDVLIDAIADAIEREDEILRIQALDGTCFKPVETVPAPTTSHSFLECPVCGAIVRRTVTFADGSLRTPICCPGCGRRIETEETASGITLKIRTIDEK